MIGIAALLAAEIGTSFLLVFTGAYLQATYGNVLGYRIRGLAIDRDHRRAQRHREALEVVAVCPVCPACAKAALNALTPQPD